jgi:hypothetical protein
LKFVIEVLTTRAVRTPSNTGRHLADEIAQRDQRQPERRTIVSGRPTAAKSPCVICVEWRGDKSRTCRSPAAAAVAIYAQSGFIRLRAGSARTVRALKDDTPMAR